VRSLGASAKCAAKQHETVLAPNQAFLSAEHNCLLNRLATDESRQNKAGALQMQQNTCNPASETHDL